MAEKAQADSSSLEKFGYKQELRRGMGLWDVVLYGVLFIIMGFTGKAGFRFLAQVGGTPL